MRGRLYFHIGPPKTATTALQYCLQDGLDGLLVYGGVSQPRSRVSNELAGRLHEVSARGASDSDIARLRDEIESVLEAGHHLFVSEEMFLVDHKGSAHQDKIRELGRIIGILSPRVLVGLREPVAGLRSLYQELYHSLPLRQRLRFREFVASNQAKVFDYEHLFRLLRQSGLGSIRLVPFDRFVNNEVWLAEIVDISADDDRCLLPRDVNQGALDRTGRRRFRAMTLSDLGQRATTYIPRAESFRRTVLSNRAVRQAWTSIKHFRVWKDSSSALLVPYGLERDLRAKFERVMQRQNAPSRRGLPEEEEV